MKNIGEAITAVAVLGIALSIIINGVANSGGKFPLQGSATCQNAEPADCILYAFVSVWVLAALGVGSLYVALRLWHKTGRPKNRNPSGSILTGLWRLVYALRVAYRNQIKQRSYHFE